MTPSIDLVRDTELLEALPDAHLHCVSVSRAGLMASARLCTFSDGTLSGGFVAEALDTTRYEHRGRQYDKVVRRLSAEASEKSRYMAICRCVTDQRSQRGIRQQRETLYHRIEDARRLHGLSQAECDRLSGMIDHASYDEMTAEQVSLINCELTAILKPRR